MDALRRLHNQKKRELIVRTVKRGACVLDCGCGRGGDLQKWNMTGARVVGVDPEEDAIVEARERCKNLGMKTTFHVGDIFKGETYGPFDVVCYNFSIHYIVETMRDSVKAIARAVKPGGLLIGITPDNDRVAVFQSPDSLGNTVVPIDSTHISVRLIDGPFYAQGARTEPVVDRHMLESALSPWFDMVEWTPMLDQPTALISDIYSTFIFRRKY